MRNENRTALPSCLREPAREQGGGRGDHRCRLPGNPGGEHPVSDDDNDAVNMKPARTISGGSRQRRLTIGRGCGGGKASPTEREEEEAPGAAL